MRQKKENPATSDPSEMIKELLILAFGSILLTYALAYILNVALFYFIMPAVCTVVPSLNATFENMSFDQADGFYMVAFELCQLVAFAVSMLLLSPAPDIRYEIFTKYTRDRQLSLKDRYLHHIKYHYQMELLISIVIIASSFLLSKTWLSSPFAVLYRTLGIPLGMLASFVLITLIQAACVVPAQKRWFIRYCLGDE